MRKLGLTVGLLLLLTGCGDPVATAPAKQDVELVAFDKADAVKACQTLAQDQVLDCMNAVANTSW